MAMAVALALHGALAPGLATARRPAVVDQPAAGPSTPGQRMLALARARRLLEAGATADAEPVLTTLLAESESAGDQTTAGLAEGALGRLHGMVGDAEGAARWFAAAETRARTHDLPRPLAWVHLLRGTDAYGRGDHDMARAEWQSALLLFERTGDQETQAFVTRALSFVSGVEAVDGLLARALDLSRRFGAAGTEGLTLHAQSDVAYLRGNWSHALTLASEALPLVERHGAPIDVARVHLSLARLHRSHGRYDEAVRSYGRARDRLTTIERAVGLSTAWATLASGLRFLGAADEATAAARTAASIAAATRNAVDATVAGYVLSDVLLHRDLPVEALAAIDAVPDPQGGTRRGLVVNRALALSALNRHAEALAAAAEADRIEGSVLDAMPLNLASLAEVRRRAGERTLAIRDAREAVAVLERLRENAVPFDRLKAGFDEGFQWVHGRLVRLLSESGQGVEALEATERARARAFADLLASRELEPHDPLDPALPALANRAEGLPISATAPPATLSDFTAEARRLNCTVLAYWTDAEGVLVWAVTADGLQEHHAVAVTSARLSALVGRTWSAAEPLGASGRASAYQQLYALLIQPVRSTLAGSTRIAVVPHGPLFRLSFAGLQAPDGRYLVERHAVHYVPSMAAAVALEVRSRAIGRLALVVVDPALTSERRQREGLPPLPGAAAEGASVARVLGVAAGEMLTGSGASEKAVRLRAPGRRVLHFATHAVAFDTQPMDSFLALAAPANEVTDDGRLTAEEVYRLSLEAELVVLSGCRTAAGQVTGDGVVGLSRAFFVAGTPSIIASLWDLPDVAGRELLPAFYRAWDRTGDKAEALRSAQLRLLARLRSGQLTVATPAGPIPVPAHPSVWAGLVLMGRP